MNWTKRMGLVTAATSLAMVAGAIAGGAALAAPAPTQSRPAAINMWNYGPNYGPAGTTTMRLPLWIKVMGWRGNTPLIAKSTTPTGLGPSQIKKVYHLSTTPKSGAGQVIAIVDAFRDPHGLSDLNTFNKQYGMPALTTCKSLSQPGACFEEANPQGVPAVSAGWVGEESLDIEWAHAEAPGAKIILVQAKSPTTQNLFGAVKYANTTIKATEVSMSWGGSELANETTFDADFTHPGTLYTASTGDSGHGTIYPSVSPNVIATGGTTLKGCVGTSCTGFTSEVAWSGSGGGGATHESLPGFESAYTGLVSGASTIKALTHGKRGVPDVSFEADPGTGVAIFDSTGAFGQKGWITVGGTSVSAPNWAGILAAGAAAHMTALQGNKAIFAGGFKTNLRDITSGKNGLCGTDCRAGKGYDLVTGLGSPINYP
ncbi:MAG TPA: S53 family peptidase [Streptosporangiaceae bacterium]|nr:S53 family peptidase [Streptosporangiaceae bacterium]